MDVRKILGDFSVALVAQGVSALCSVITTLLVPKVLGVEEFGYWQLYIFYIGYVGFFHFGLNDGVYLINGGKSRRDIDKKNINSQFWLMSLVQTCLAAVVAVVALVGPFGMDRGFVLLMTAIMIVLNNASLYWGYVLQAMNETRLFSVSVVVDSVLFLAPLVFLMLGNVGVFEPYVLAYTAAKLGRLAYCLVRCRDFLRSGLENWRSVLPACRESMTAGLKLLIANTTGSLILGAIRFAVDANWGIETFSTVSFSLSLVGFFILFISQASMVLFPSLRQAADKEMSVFFINARDALGCFLPLIYLLYLPITWMLGLWLPEYNESLHLFALLLPLCVFDGRMDIVGTTYLKVLRKEGLLLRINIIALAISVFGALFGVFLFHSVEFMVLVAAFSIIWRCLFTEGYVSRELGVPDSRLDVGSIAVSVAAVASNWFIGGVIGFFLTLVAYVAFLVFRRREFRRVLLSVRSVLRTDGR